MIYMTCSKLKPLRLLKPCCHHFETENCQSNIKPFSVSELLLHGEKNLATTAMKVMTTFSISSLSNATSLTTTMAKWFWQIHA